MANSFGTSAARAEDPETPQSSSASVGPDKTAKGDDDQAYYHWSKRNGLYRPVGHTQDAVPAGIYDIDNDNSGWYLEGANGTLKDLCGNYHVKPDQTVINNLELDLVRRIKEAGQKANPHFVFGDNSRVNWLFEK